MRKALFSSLLFLGFLLWIGVCAPVFVVPVYGADDVIFEIQDDTWTWLTNPTTNYDYPVNNYLDCGNSMGARYSFICFNSSDIWGFGSCGSARLWLYVKLTLPYWFTWKVYRVVGSWYASSLIYNNMPEVDSVYIASYQDKIGNSSWHWINFDLTDFFNSWFIHAFDWHGFRIYGMNDTAVCSMYQVDYPSAPEIGYLEFDGLVGSGLRPSGSWFTVPNYVQFITVFCVVGMPAFVMGAYGARQGWGLQGLLFGGLLGLGVGVLCGLIPFWFVFLISLFMVVFLYSMARRS